MKRYRVLVAWKLWPEIHALPVAVRRALYRKFDRLEEVPDTLSEFQWRDENGRMLDGFVPGRMAFIYWIDFTDRQVKVLSIVPADRTIQSP